VTAVGRAARGRPNVKARANFTDPESWIVKNGDGAWKELSERSTGQAGVQGKPPFSGLF
jgi:hypothetical protein